MSDQEWTEDGRRERERENEGVKAQLDVEGAETSQPSGKEKKKKNSDRKMYVSKF